MNAEDRISQYVAERIAFFGVPDRYSCYTLSRQKDITIRNTENSISFLFLWKNTGLVQQFWKKANVQKFHSKALEFSYWLLVHIKNNVSFLG